ncbi:MAG: nucleoside:proton symporter [Rhodospirillales bacterium]|nr:nucleoside:proton symporter [Rhodospirillales bacterium]
MLQSLIGILGLTALAWLVSENRRRVSWKVAAGGLAFQFLLALVLLKLPMFKTAFLALGDLVGALQKATRAGTGFVFGYLGGGPLPFVETQPGASFVLAFQALPLVLIMSALSALLYHWRILPLVVRGFAWVLRRTMGIGGAVGVSSAANAFLGMVEAPLLIRPYLLKLSRGELFVVMTGGMATIAGTVMVLYATFLERVIPDPLGHLLIASLISVPAAIMVGKMMIPDDARTADDAPPPRLYSGSMDAIAKGTQDGIQLLIGIVAMLVVLVGLVHLANGLLGLLPDLAGQPITLERLFGFVMLPIVWLMGIPWAEAMTAATLMGTKTVLNELLAYLDLARLPPGALGERSRIILTYGMCGFANFGSLGILIGGMGAMVPERRDEIVALGFRAIVSGTLASCLTGAVVGLLL